MLKRILVLAALFAAAALPAAAQGIYPAEIKPKVFDPVPVLKPGQPLKPGTLFKDCPTCPDMMVVPAGIFVMGSPKDKNEIPTRVIRVKKPFAISRFEILHTEWDACLAAGACKHKPHDHNWGKNRMPVMNINHGMAQGFARWLSETTGKKYRLPSEAEWEYAARAGTKTEYWFGDDVGQNRVNCRECGSPWSGIGNAPVGSFDPNPWGLYDMNGNAFEWVEDCWHENYNGAPKDMSAWTEGNCQLRVIRGGSWYYYSRMSRAATRQKNAADIKSYWLTFRVVREIN